MPHEDVWRNYHNRFRIKLIRDIVKYIEYLNFIGYNENKATDVIFNTKCKILEKWRLSKLKYTTDYEDELQSNLKLNYMVKNFKRMFQFIITDDNDESYIPNLDSDYVLCDCNSGEDFTLGKTWKKYFDGYNNEPVLFINTSSMFEQFQEKAGENGINMPGAGLWAKYFYLYRDKMRREQRTKFIFVITEPNLIEMIRAVDHGFSIEFTPIYVEKTKQKEKVITKK